MKLLAHGSRVAHIPAMVTPHRGPTVLRGVVGLKTLGASTHFNCSLPAGLEVGVALAFVTPVSLLLPALTEVAEGIGRGHPSRLRRLMEVDSAHYQVAD